MIRGLTAARLMSFSLTSFVPPVAGAAPASSMSPLCSSAIAAASRVGPFTKSRVKVVLSCANNRLSHPDPLVEASIHQLWDAHKQRAPRIFNGTKFRLHNWRIINGADPVLELQCGLTDYKTYLGTCCSELVTRLRDDGKQLHNGDVGAFLSRKIGVSAVLETSDQRVALIERSKGVGVYQQLFDTPGGHPEPSELSLTLESLEALEANADARQETEAKAVDRLFGSIVDEIHEEINVSGADLTEPLLLGIVWQSEAETPSFVFYLSTALSSADVDALYRLGPMDKFESTQLRWVDHHEATSKELKLTPAAQGSLSLWQQYCTVFK